MTDAESGTGRKRRQRPQTQRDWAVRSREPSPMSPESDAPAIFVVKGPSRRSWIAV